MIVSSILSVGGGDSTQTGLNYCRKVKSVFGLHLATQEH